MKIDEQFEGDVTIIRPQGPIAGSDAENFRAQLARLVTERPPRIILDATKVSFMDSLALEAIAETTEQLIRTGEALKLIGVNDVLHEVLELTELAPLFEEYEDLSSCLTAAGLTGAVGHGESRVMVSARKVRVGEVLVEEGIITKEQLDGLLAEQKGSGRFLGEILVEQGLVSNAKLVSVLGSRLGVRGCELRPGMVDPPLLKLIGEEEAMRLKSLPMFKVRDTLTVAMAEPQSLPNIDRLRELTGCAIRPVLAFERNIVEFIKKHSRTSVEIDNVLASLAETDLEVLEGTEPEEQLVTDLDATTEGSPVVNLVNMVLLRAVRDGASDIHIEPDKQSTRIRYRIDGVLRDLMKPPPGMHPSIISRVKVIGKMDIGERRLPQEGRVRIIADGREIDLRVSSMPTVLGEKVVIRILDKGNLRVRMEDLGFRTEALTAFIRMLRQPYGMVLVTGPTGSGKTTTLYSALSMLRSPELNIVTVENPVEYQLDLINQVQVHEMIGMTFAKALRSILRQDPDIIMIGEIRDEETARVSVQAALTGHMVLATLHTNDAPGSVARLVDMGIEPYLLSGALNGAVAQRLVRCVCPDCMEKYHPEANVLKDAGLEGRDDLEFVKGTGCPRCHESGFLGRIGIYEVMEVTPALRHLVHRGDCSEEFRQTWQQQGGMTLRQEGVLLATEGKTSLEEVLSASHGEADDLPESDDPRPASQVATGSRG